LLFWFFEVIAVFWFFVLAIPACALRLLSWKYCLGDMAFKSATWWCVNIR
jgi:hypothetical protein|tara:strand:- start:8503 stop:8652 length:150 start_codon:yes stop_codon:yes gene_type:complete